MMMLELYMTILFEPVRMCLPFHLDMWGQSTFTFLKVGQEVEI